MLPPQNDLPYAPLNGGNSGSMEPAFSRGDILFLTGNPSGQQYHTGDITVYKVPGQDIPIVHRVILETRDIHWGSNG